uniref:Ig-like domain-containing protein n=1 Tax=Monopterus albus TaxID=43700 RepID=A0A3Q3JJ17_MONAL|nr:CMRF35-like molecule 1 [Monopterus albus]
MRTPFFLNATVLCLFWLTKHRVDPFQLSAPKVVTAAYGGSVTVSCQYNNRYRENKKYWCKGQIYELCRIVVKTPMKQSSDRSSIIDDKEAGVFTITMTSIGESDQDMYWCVIATSGRNIHTGIKILVSHTVVTPPTTTQVTMEHDKISWWVTLRWILFVLMLCCLVGTHIAVWRTKAAKTVSPQQQLCHKNAGIYK